MCVEDMWVIDFTRLPSEQGTSFTKLPFSNLVRNSPKWPYIHGMTQFYWKS